MSAGAKPRTLILATSYANQARTSGDTLAHCQRTDYLELAESLDSEVIDYSAYGRSPARRKVHRLERLFRMDILLAIWGLRRQAGFDAVVLMSERVAIPFMLLRRTQPRRAATVMVSAHSSAKQAALVRSTGAFRQLDIVVSNTHAQRDFLVDEMGINESAIRYVTYAVDERFFTPGPGGDYIFSAGGVAGRDYGTFFAAVDGIGMPAKVAAGGRFYGLDAGAVRASVPANVDLLSPTDPCGMRDLYQRAAVVVVPLHSSRKDAAGCSVVLEGMCAGRPVIASRTEGMLDYLENGRTGILVQPEDPKALRDAILTVVANRALQERCGKHARAEVEGRLSLTEFVQGLAGAVEDARTASSRNLGVSPEARR